MNEIDSAVKDQFELSPESVRTVDRAILLLKQFLDATKTPPTLEASAQVRSHPRVFVASRLLRPKQGFPLHSPLFGCPSFLSHVLTLL